MGKKTETQQELCDRSVDMSCFTREVQDICPIIRGLMDKHSRYKVYVGITVHPCRRYTGSASTTALPTGYAIGGDYVQVEDLILESPHKLRYEKMYVLSSSTNLEAIRNMEIQAIACAMNYRLQQVDNKNPGGEGPDAESNVYYLYLCISYVMLD